MKFQAVPFVLVLALFCSALQAQEQGPSRDVVIAPDDAIFRVNPKDGEIESTPEELFKFANLLYSYGQYKEAQVKYTEFLAAHPESPNVEKAWYQIGDCYFNMDRLKETKNAFDTVITSWPNGRYAGPAAYRMAEITFNQNNFKEAIPYLQTAIKSFSDANLKLEAQFFLAHALQMANRNEDAIKAYQVVMNSKGATPFRERAELDLAKLLLDKGDSEAALKHFTTLAKTAKDPAIKDEAQFKAGILSLSSKDGATATAFLRETLKSSKNAQFKAEAQVALMLQAWEDKNYNGVIEYYSLAPLKTTGTARADLEMMLAHSQRHLKKYALAISTYGGVEQRFEGTSQSTEAGYRKLQCYYESGDKELASAVDRYVASQSKINPNVKYIDLALLLKAEALFAKGSYKESAEAYKNVRTENIQTRYAPARLYKMGWALTESKQFAEGIDALGQFVAAYPEHNLVASALAQRALTYQRMGNEDAALKDFQIIAKKHPDFENLEYVLRTTALIQASKKNWPETVSAYRELLEKFPDSTAKAEANYWIGSGLYAQGRYRECVPSLEKARELNKEEYEEKASLRIILATYNLEMKEQKHFDALLEETNAYVIKGSTLPIPVEVYSYLGTKLFEKKDFKRAERYLLKVANYAKPLRTPYHIWDKLAQIRMQNGAYEAAVTDLDNYLQHQHHPEPESRAYLDKAACHLQLAADGKNKMEQLDKAKAAADEVLRLIRRGKLNSEARIVLGDISMAKNLPDEAAQNYVIVCEFGSDPDVVPTALDKIIKALESQGKTSEAKVYQDQLNARYPDYKQQG